MVGSRWTALYSRVNGQRVKAKGEKLPMSPQPQPQPYFLFLFIPSSYLLATSSQLMTFQMAMR